MISFDEFKCNLEAVRKRIVRSAQLCGRDPGTIRLLPVTKTHGPEVLDYVKRSGMDWVGENRVQETIEKQGTEWRGRIRWELIGHLQSNKVKHAVESFDRIQSVDSVSLLSKLNRHAGDCGIIMPVLLQFNTGRDPAKSGFETEDAEMAVEACLRCDALKLEGLMTIAPLVEDPAAARLAFAGLRSLRDRLSRTFGIALPELSMGMTSDMEAAIEEGSTCLRIGTALFGGRTGGADHAG